MDSGSSAKCPRMSWHGQSSRAAPGCCARLLTPPNWRGLVRYAVPSLARGKMLRTCQAVHDLVPYTSAYRCRLVVQNRARLAAVSGCDSLKDSYGDSFAAPRATGADASERFPRTVLAWSVVCHVVADGL